MKLSYAGGTQTQAYSVSLEEEKTQSVAEGCFVNTTLMAGGGAFGFSAYAGVTAGYERLEGSSISTASMTSTETSGTVQNLTSDLAYFGFDWKLIGWKTSDLFAGVPFVGYAVKNQKDLPQAVDDLKAVYSAENQTVTLSWTAPTANSGRMPTQYYYAYNNLEDGYIKACSYSSSKQEYSMTIDVSEYDAAGATFWVIPFNEYYNLRGMPSNEVYCLFAMSAKGVEELIQNLKDQIKALTEALEEQGSDFEAKLAELIAAYQAADEALQSQVDDLEEAQNALKKAMEEADAVLQAAIDKVREDLTKAIDDLSKVTAENLAEAISNLTAAYTNADALLKAEIDGNLADLEGRMNEADAALQEAIDKVREELSAAIENLRQATEENLEQAITDLTEAYLSADTLLKADIDALSGKLAALEQTMIEADNALQTTIEKIQADLAAVKKELESAMVADVERLNNKISTLTSALEAAYKLSDEMLKKDIDGLSQRLDELDAKHNEDVDALRTELETKHKEDIDALRAELEALKAQIAEQDEINDAQQKKMDTTRTITVVGLCIGSIFLLGYGALLLFLLKRKSLTKV